MVLEHELAEVADDHRHDGHPAQPVEGGPGTEGGARGRSVGGAGVGGTGVDGGHRVSVSGTAA